jgi:hypothetical protein
MINAGLQTRVPMITNGTWYVVAEDGNAYPYPREQYTAFLPAAKSLDVYYTPPATGAGGATTGTRTVGVFDRRMAVEADTLAAAPNGIRGQFINLSVSNVAPPAPTSPTVTVAACPTTGTQGLAYTCTAVGNAAGYAYSLITSPAGMTIDANTGVMSWTPTNAQAARPAAPATNNPVTVRATAVTGTYVGQFADASLTVTVANVNDAPSGAAAQAYTVAGGALTVPAATGVLVGVTDIDGDPLAASVVTAPVNGTVTMNADGSFTYKAATLPATGSATTTFTFQASDVPALPLNPGPALSTTPTTVTLTLLPNILPTAVNDTATVSLATLASRTITVSVASNDSDTDGTIDLATVRLVTGPGVLTVTNGGLNAITTRGSILSVNSTTGVVTYTAGLLVNTTTRNVENFYYRVRDNFGGLSGTATVRVTAVP